MDELIAFVLAGVALTASPGPATLSVAASGAAFGAKQSLVYVAGILVGVVLVMTVTATGVTGIVLAIEGAAPVIATVGAAYIVYLAYRIATAPPLAEDNDQRRPPSFFGGFLIGVANPKAYAVMAALFSGFVLVGDHAALDAVIKATILLVIMTLADLAWLLTGASLTRFLRSPGANRAINIAFAVLLVVAIGFALRF